MPSLQVTMKYFSAKTCPGIAAVVPVCCDHLLLTFAGKALPSLLAVPEAAVG
jgi:hypothetical protein